MSFRYTIICLKQSFNPRDKFLDLEKEYSHYILAYRRAYGVFCIVFDSEKHDYDAWFS